MLECPLYKDMEKRYMKEYSWKYPNIPKLIEAFDFRQYKIK